MCLLLNMARYSLVSPSSWLPWPSLSQYACSLPRFTWKLLHFFHKICCMFLFLKSNTLSSSPVVGALKLTSQVEVDFWKLPTFGLAPPSTLGFFLFTICWYWILRPSRQILSRVLTPIFLKALLIVTPTGNPIGPPKSEYKLWCCKNVDHFKIEIII